MSETENENSSEMVDLMYFGYEWDEGSKEADQEFIKEFSADFPDGKLQDAFDDIKGYRRTVYVDKAAKEDYLVWVLAKGWYGSSMTIMLMEKEDVDKLVDIIRIKYPEAIREN